MFFVLVSPAYVTQMLEIQPYRLIGQSLRQAIQYLFETKKSFYFHHICSSETPTKITLSVQHASTTKRLQKKCQISLIDYLLIEVFHHYFQPCLSKVRSPITESKPNLVESVWQHILTRFVLNTCSPLLIQPATTTKNSSLITTIQDLQYWSDEQACLTLQRFIEISAQCTDCGQEPTDFAHANEYLVSILQKMATTGCLFSN